MRFSKLVAITVLLLPDLAHALTLTHETYATAPSNQSRTVLAMGEVVYLEVLDNDGAPISGWSASISSTANGASVWDVSGGAGASFQFNAPLGSSNTTVEVTLMQVPYSDQQEEFACVIPTGIKITSAPVDIPPWSSGDGGIGMAYSYPVRFQPSTVNFYNLSKWEERTEALPEKTSMPGSWAPTPVPPPRPGCTNPCDYPFKTPTEYDFPSNPAALDFGDLIGLPALDPNSCIKDDEGTPTDYSFTGGFDDEFMDYSGGEHDFEYHQIVLNWKSTGKANAWLLFYSGQSAAPGALQGPFAW